MNKWMPGTKARKIEELEIAVEAKNRRIRKLKSRLVVYQRYAKHLRFMCMGPLRFNSAHDEHEYRLEAARAGSAAIRETIAMEDKVHPAGAVSGYNDQLEDG